MAPPPLQPHLKRPRHREQIRTCFRHRRTQQLTSRQRKRPCCRGCLLRRRAPRQARRWVHLSAVHCRRYRVDCPGRRATDPSRRRPSLRSTRGRIPSPRGRPPCLGRRRCLGRPPSREAGTSLSRRPGISRERRRLTPRTSPRIRTRGRRRRTPRPPRRPRRTTRARRRRAGRSSSARSWSLRSQFPASTVRRHSTRPPT
mmetsp:Transcript_71918/g.181473  ORF Transcript_71918/g.181473 Transcript_71918/m.181473 type:complete len:200 (-) Transcript_71918:512-1111(-)